MMDEMAKWEEENARIRALRARFPDGFPTCKRALRKLSDDDLGVIASRLAMDESHMRGHGGYFYRTARRGRANIAALLAERTDGAGGAGKKELRGARAFEMARAAQVEVAK